MKSIDVFVVTVAALMLGIGFYKLYQERGEYPGPSPAGAAELVVEPGPPPTLVLPKDTREAKPPSVPENAPAPTLFRSFVVRVVLNTREAQDAQWVRERFSTLGAQVKAIDPQVERIELIRVSGVMGEGKDLEVVECWKAGKPSTEIK